MMTAERDIDVLLRDMKPDLRPGVFVFCTIAARESIPAGLSPLLIFREQEGTTLIVLREEAEAAGLRYEFPSRLITLAVHSALDAVGFLAAITTHLAEVGISVNAVSAFHHDHLFIPSDKVEDAMAALQDISEATQD